MFEDDSERGPSTNLRGWLSDVYFPALIQGALEALGARLGGKATLDDPTFGRTKPGMPAIELHLKNLAAWLTALEATYTRGQFTTGIDRDLTEGALTLKVNAKAIDVPVAVVAERRRSREVELRIYYAASIVNDGVRTQRTPQPQNESIALPQMASDLVDALRRGKAEAALDSFEADGSLRDARGVVHVREGGALEAYFRKLIEGGWDGQKLGAADDGRTCAIEYAITRAYGAELQPQAALFAIERGDSGLIREMRAYDDLARS